MPDAHIKFVQYTPHFLKSFQKLPVPVQRLAKEKDRLFRMNPFDARLHTHKLRGELSGAWSYSVNYGCRVLFRFISDTEVVYYDIGTHDIYR